MHNVASLFEVYAHTVQRLVFAECFSAPLALIALHNPVMILETTAFLGFSVAAMTVHLTFRGLSVSWFCIFADTTGGFGLWLRPVSAETLTGLFVYYKYDCMLACKHCKHIFQFS
jgi:hypothetical protein